MKWEDFREKFCAAVDLTDRQLEYIIHIVSRFEELLAAMQITDPQECIRSIALHAEIVNQIFQVEDIQVVPVQAIERALHCLSNMQRFLAGFIRLAMMLQILNEKQAQEFMSASQFEIPKGTTWH